MLFSSFLKVSGASLFLHDDDNMQTVISGNWRFVDTKENTGMFNMEFDEQCARTLLAGAGVPTLRLFRWKPWAVSIGFNQNIGEIDVEKCAALGIDVVRRPTGGRAILHAEELTYSVVMLAGRHSVLEIYNMISKALVNGLSLFGIEATLQRLQPNFAETYKHPSSIPCFTASARYEIELNGRKLVGSAQRRYRNDEREVVLQHGSILTGPAHRRLADLLALSNHEVVDQVRDDLTRNTVDLSEASGGSVDLDRLASCIRRGFELEWGVAFSRYEETVLTS